jgi:hypothetical protein
MSVRSASRTAIDGWLRVARLPFDAATQVLATNRGPGNAATLVVDRADATVRAAVGGLLHDNELLADAARRRAAADERQRAIALHREADERQMAADAQLSRELDAAARLREEGEREAQTRMEKADHVRARRSERAREQADAHERAAEAAHREQRAAETKEAKRARLALLEEQASALGQEADALTAKDEAQRLRDAASTAKSARKNSD